MVNEIVQGMDVWIKENEYCCMFSRIPLQCRLGSVRTWKMNDKPLPSEWDDLYKTQKIKIILFNTYNRKKIELIFEKSEYAKTSSGNSIRVAIYGELALFGLPFFNDEEIDNSWIATMYQIPDL